MFTPIDPKAKPAGELAKEQTGTFKDPTPGPDN